MKIKHTPGEWLLHENLRSINSEENLSIADVWYNNTTMVTEEEGLANAKLIAASPNLLEACEIAYKICDKLQYPTENELKTLSTLLKSAINKATL